MSEKKGKARTKQSAMFGDRHLLACALCRDSERSHLIVEDLGISVGLFAEEYSFCRDCWNSPDLGEKLLGLLGFPDGVKIADSDLELDLWEGD
ncbi:MAG: hypothetical protein GTN70_06425 [Deltaproteobacteria bacterium]|nr:hypothetical protein [Deltaproteobacteria bacterium]NIS77317.1 hypothetical protein [Deltaproteobacteria bacterium]